MFPQISQATQARKQDPLMKDSIFANADISMIDTA